MIKFTEKPNLPDGRVKALICGTEDESMLSFFRSRGIEVIKNTPNPNIDLSVSTHADMAAIHLGKENVVADKKQTELCETLKSLGMKVYESEASAEGEYPDDIGLNFAFVGKYLLGKFNCVDNALLNNIGCCEKIDVKQGYCKCSVLAVNENAIITDDEGIHRKASQKGIKSLLVSKGDISLDGHPYGFIGGASGKISADTVLFFGNIENHRDIEKIKAFLSSEGCGYECTDNGQLRDIGGIIPIIEE